MTYGGHEKATGAQKSDAGVSASEKVVKRPDKTLDAETFSKVMLMQSDNNCEIWKAIRAHTEKGVLIKRWTDPRMHSNDSQQAAVFAIRMLREAKILRHLHGHSDIVTFLGLLTPPHPGSFRDTLMMLDFMPKSLHDLLQEEKNLEPEVVDTLMFQLVRGVEFMHESGVMHRDLKPENLLVDPGEWNLKISGFGLSRVAFEPLTLVPWADLQLWSKNVVSLPYRPPELLLVKTSHTFYSSAIDVWSIGCIFAEMMLGRPLFECDTEKEDEEEEKEKVLLSQILRFTGTPSKDGLDRLPSEEARDFVMSKPMMPGEDMSKLFPDGTDEEALDLLQRILVFDPLERPSAAELLEDQYFSEILEKRGYKIRSVSIDMAEFAFDATNEDEPSVTLETLLGELTKELDKSMGETKSKAVEETNREHSRELVRCMKGKRPTSTTARGSSSTIPTSTGGASTYTSSAVGASGISQGPVFTAGDGYDVEPWTVRRLSEDEYGDLWEAHCTDTDTPVILRRLKALEKEPLRAVRMLREAKILAGLGGRHNIIGFHGFLTPSSTKSYRDSIMVYEALTKSLRMCLEEKLERGPETVRSIMFQLACGVRFMHNSRVMHRDIRPENLLFDSKTRVLKISGFSLSRVAFKPDMMLSREPLQMWSSEVGALEYRPPELLLATTSRTLYNNAIDVWSMGCIFGELLLGEALFQGKSMDKEEKEKEIMRSILHFTGKPSGKTIDRLWSSKARDFVRAYNPEDPAIEPLQFPGNTEEEALELLKRMLTFDPLERPRAEDMLKDGYFSKIVGQSIPGEESVSFDETQFAFDNVPEDDPESDTRQLLFDLTGEAWTARNYREGGATITDRQKNAHTLLQYMERPS